MAKLKQICDFSDKALFTEEGKALKKKKPLITDLDIAKHQYFAIAKEQGPNSTAALQARDKYHNILSNYNIVTERIDALQAEQESRGVTKLVFYSKEELARIGEQHALNGDIEKVKGITAEVQRRS